MLQYRYLQHLVITDAEDSVAGRDGRPCAPGKGAERWENHRLLRQPEAGQFSGTAAKAADPDRRVEMAADQGRAEISVGMMCKADRLDAPRFHLNRNGKVGRRITGMLVMITLNIYNLDTSIVLAPTTQEVECFIGF